MRALSVLRGALVLLAALAFNKASAAFSSNPADTIPLSCVNRMAIGKMLDALLGDGSSSDLSYSCTSGSNNYTVTSDYIEYAISKLSIGGYSTGSIEIEDFKSAPNRDSQCNSSERLEYYVGYDKDSSYDLGGGSWVIIHRTVISGGSGAGELARQQVGGSAKTYSSELAGKQQISAELTTRAANLKDAYSKYHPCWIQNALIAQVEIAFTNGYRQINAPPDTTPPGTTPPGTAAPSDTQTNCSILDIPCNFRFFFISQEDWPTRFEQQWTILQDKAPFGYAKRLDFANMPFQADGNPFGNNYGQAVCPPINLQYLDVSGNRQVASLDWCGSPFAAYWHDHIRNLLAAFLSFAGAAAVVRIALA